MKNAPSLLAFGMVLACVGRIPALAWADASSGSRYALIICGHPGDEAHRAMYSRTVRTLFQAFTDGLGFAEGRVWIRFGAEQLADGEGTSFPSRGLSTAEAIRADVAELRARLGGQDSLWVIVLGHAHYDHPHSFLNVPGPDLHETEFAELFQKVKAKEQVFFITTAASGFFLKPLSAPGRVVISATEADQEVNETVFHLELADALAQVANRKAPDIDKDGAISLLELYLVTFRGVLLRYRANNSIPTEHAQLDDNGDGRGTEIQLDFWDADLNLQGSVPTHGRIRPNVDGGLAARILLVPSDPPQPRPADDTNQPSSEGDLDE